jgi:hypothetical protein
MTDNPSDHRVELQSAIERLRAAISSLADIPEVERSLQAQLAEKERQLGALQLQAGGVNLGVGNVIGQTGDIVGGDKHEHYYGFSDTPARSTLLREYLGTLIGTCNRLSLADADSSDPTRAAVELASIYTQLEVASVAPLDTDDKQPNIEYRQRTAIEVLSMHSRLVLLGEPGGGKSTFVNFLGLCLAHAHLGKPGWLERIGHDWTHGPLLPVRVVLREFSTWLDSHDNHSVPGEVALFWDWLAHCYGVFLSNILRQEVVAGRTLILLDGLDEVPASAGGRKHMIIRQIFEALASTASSSHILVTCRVLDYAQSQLQLRGWHTETLLPFSVDLRQQFITRWYAALAGLDRPMNGDPEDLRTQLQIQWLMSNKRAAAVAAASTSDRLSLVKRAWH